MATDKTTSKPVVFHDDAAIEKALTGAKLPDLRAILTELELHTESLDATEWELLAQFCAKIVMRQVSNLDPRWARMIEAARIETGRADWQLLGAWIARVLENGNHINAPDHPYFRPGAGRIVEAKCGWPECGKTFKPEYPGQAYCSNECGTKAFKETMEAKRAADEEMAKAIAARKPQRPVAQVATKA